MIRAIASVVIGYVAMFVVMFLLFSASYLVMGQDLAFRPGIYEPSALWLVSSFVLGLLAAVVGGIVCSRISGSAKTPKVLAAVVFGLGLVFAVPVLVASSEVSEARTGDVSNMDAMMKGKQPGWVALLNPFVGAVGVILGGRLRKVA